MADAIILPSAKPTMDAEGCLKHLEGPFATNNELLHAVVDVVRSQLQGQVPKSSEVVRHPPPPAPTGPHRPRPADEKE